MDFYSEAGIPKKRPQQFQMPAFSQTLFSTLLCSPEGYIPPSTVRFVFHPDEIHLWKVPLGCLLNNNDWKCPWQKIQYCHGLTEQLMWLRHDLAQHPPLTPGNQKAPPETLTLVLHCTPGGLADLQWSVACRLGIKCTKVHRKTDIRAKVS